MRGLPQTIMSVMISSILGVLAIGLILDLGAEVDYAFGFDLFGIIALFAALVVFAMAAGVVMKRIQ